MGMLDRYKKAGGFLQLLHLLETCGPQKREKFLSIIKEENSAWEEALKSRIITFERFLSWPQEVISEVTIRLQPIVLAGCIKAAPEEHQGKLSYGFGFGQMRKIDEQLDTKDFSPGELSASIEKLIQEIRLCITQGLIKLDKLDPELFIPENIEDALRQGAAPSPKTPQEPPSPSSQIGSSPAHMSVVESQLKSSPNKTSANNEDVQILRHQIQQLIHENNKLKSENQMFKDKLDKIRKIA